MSKSKFANNQSLIWGKVKALTEKVKVVTDVLKVVKDLLEIGITLGLGTYLLHACS
jgi:hypothetical protein